MITRIDIRLLEIKDTEIRKSIRADIEFIQLSTSTKEFETMIVLFENKYSTYDEDVREFVNYFSHQWVLSLPGWYEGFAPSHPSSNNGLEATNRWIKNNQYRERLPVNEFLSVLTSLPQQWSIERRENGRKKWANAPNSRLSYWTGACQSLQDRNQRF
jgi:hypothetical protein